MALDYQTRLQNYGTDQNAAIKELLRTKQVAEARAAQGLDITDQNNWGNQVRLAGGLGAEYGSGVTAKQAQNSYNTYNNNNQMQSLLSSLQNNKFNYTATDAARSPEYKAAQQLMQRQVQNDNRSTMEALNDRGILNSTITADQTALNQQNASDKLAGIIPGLIQNRLSQYNAEQGNQFNLLNAYTGMQNTAQNQANADRSFGLQQNQFDYTKTTGDREWNANPQSQADYLDLWRRGQEASIANTLHSANAPYGGGSPSITQTTRQSYSGAVQGVGDALAALSQNYGSQAYADRYSTESGMLAPIQVVEQQINNQRAGLISQGIDPDDLIDNAYKMQYGMDRKSYWGQF